jgi:hypothetical protein
LAKPSSSARRRGRLSLDEVDESSPDDVLAVVALSSDWLVLVGCVELVVEVLPSDPLAAIVPKAIANVASAAATTRRRIAATRRARARRRSRTRSEFEGGARVRGHAGKLGGTLESSLGEPWEIAEPAARSRTRAVRFSA